MLKLNGLSMKQREHFNIHYVPMNKKEVEKLNMNNLKISNKTTSN
jgi:hypothetical protein